MRAVKFICVAAPPSSPAMFNDSGASCAPALSQLTGNLKYLACELALSAYLSALKPEA